MHGASPSTYLFNGTGLGLFSITDGVPSGSNAGDEYESATGYGLLFGGGYAFTQGFHLDASLMYLDITDDENFVSKAFLEANTTVFICHYIAKSRGAKSVFRGGMGAIFGPLATPFVLNAKPIDAQ